MKHRAHRMTNIKGLKRDKNFEYTNKPNSQ